LWEIIIRLRRGDIGLDIIAALSITAALAAGEYLAADIVALMYAGGQYLEDFAQAHARREMTALLARVPRSAMRHRNGSLEEVPLDTIEPGDRLLIRQGDVVPVDGTVLADVAVIDQSALTGEALPVQQRGGDAVLSGSTNAGPAFDLLALRLAAESTYAGILRLVETAQHSKAPMSRLADRYALAFLAATLIVASAAWLMSGTALRAVAVLVVATPCPLILAVPVAIVSGLSRAARQGILIKSGQALEGLARVRTLVADKTGTLTQGEARLVAARAANGFSENELLRLAASLDQASKHSVARRLVSEATSRGLQLSVPTDVIETPGEGVEGRVDGCQIVVGGIRFVAGRLGSAAIMQMSERAPGELAVAVGVAGAPAGVLHLADELRLGMKESLEELRRLGIERIVLATGDRSEVARAMAQGLPIDALRSSLTPDQKLLTVLSERKNGPVLMVGDGINDAPALAAADVGVAMGAKGAPASAEAADVVLLVDQFDRIPAAIRMARLTRFIALQSACAGIGLSLVGMIAASFGLLTPVQGALFQEMIDVGVIVNALRVLRQDH
jgi:heavy metal translocating P-type ATPase